MMTRLALRIAWLTLVGVMTGFGGGKLPLPAPQTTDLPLVAVVTNAVQGLGNLMTTAAAEAAVIKKAPRKKKACQTTTAVRTNKPRKSTARLKKPAPRKLTATNQKKVKPRVVKQGPPKCMTARKGKIRAKSAVATVAKSSFRKRSVGGRCEPQSLTYARERSGIMRSRSGHENGPLTWFASEKRLGKTSDQPAPGSVLILGADRGHGMSTGHVAFVEQAAPSGPSRYKLLFSHTNYDRRCSLETNIEAIYNSSAKTLDIYSGAWQPWGRGLKVAGFIEQE